MKRIILGIALIAGVTCIASAQSKTKVETKADGSTTVKVKGDGEKAERQKPEDIAKQTSMKMKEMLELNETQYQQVREVILLVERKLYTIQPGTESTDEKTSYVKNEVNEYREKQFKEILNETQYKKWKESMKSKD
jgi:hypothetical protein